MQDTDTLTGYELSRQWFDFCFENPEKISPVHTAIYMFAVEHWNRLGHKKKFGFPSQMTMDAIGVKSYNTYIPAFRDLVDWGFFILIEKSKNQYSANIIALSIIDKASDKASDKALDKALIKHSTKHLQSKCSIDKQVNKEQRTKNNSAIENLYNAYPRKIAPAKAKEKIEIALRSNEYDYLLDRVQEYARCANGKEKQFIPHPATWFHQERYNDDPAEWKEEKKEKDTFTYEEMLHEAHKRGLTQASFAMCDETDSKGRKKWTMK